MNNVIERPNYDSLLGGKTVSIVNCAPGLCDMIRAVFSAQGANVICVTDGNPCPESDVLVCGFGLLPDGSLESLGSEAVSRALFENFSITSRAMEVVLPYMKEKKCGTIVSIIPEYATFSIPGVATKATLAGAMKSLTASFAMDQCKFNIRANCIECDLSPSENGETAKDLQPIQREINEMDVANAALFLATPMSSFISGETLSVNGGRFCIGHNQAWRDWLKVI